MKAAMVAEEVEAVVGIEAAVVVMVTVVVINAIIDRRKIFHEAGLEKVPLLFCPFVQSVALAEFLPWEFRCAILNR